MYAFGLLVLTVMLMALLVHLSETVFRKGRRYSGPALTITCLVFLGLLYWACRRIFG